MAAEGCQCWYPNVGELFKMDLFRSLLQRRLLCISEEEVRFARRGFHARSASAQRQLEAAGEAFVAGYNLSLGERDGSALAERIRARVTSELQGFAFEGAGMARKLVGLLLPWRAKDYWAWLHTAASEHCYMVHVGAGWALAQLGLRRWRVTPQGYHPIWHWLVADGIGFHCGFFKTTRYIKNDKRRPRLRGYAARAFDQGLGRCLWFVNGTDPAKIVGAIGRFDSARRNDLWSGVGLACTYAGGADEESIAWLRELAGPYACDLAQGATFAAKARQRAGSKPGHTEKACRLICGQGIEEAANLTDAMLEDLRDDSHLPPYEVWRGRIREALTSTGVVDVESARAVSKPMNGSRVERSP